MVKIRQRLKLILFFAMGLVALAVVALREGPTSNQHQISFHSATDSIIRQDLDQATASQNESENVAQAFGRSCCHRDGRCSLGASAEVGSLCYCPSATGPVEGSVC